MLICILFPPTGSANENLLLGKSIYVPNEDLLGSIPSGIYFFDEVSIDCVEKIANPTLIKDQSFYHDTESLLKSIATQTGLRMEVTKLFSLGASLDATTKSVSSSDRSVSGTSLNIAKKDFDVQFASKCLHESKLQDGILDDFVNLPLEVAQPWFKESWLEYDVFLHTHGSHVITAVTYGASIDQYAFAKKSSSYTEKQFTVKACASLPGEVIGAAGLSLSACAGLTKDDVKNLSSTKMTTSITIRGGSLETRNRLISDKSTDVIFKFLSEGSTDPAPIRYKLTPIWQVLNNQNQVKNSNPHKNIQVSNLRYYFEGFLNFDCPYIPADDRGPDLQLFNYAAHSKPERPVFQCTLAPQGCHHDNDCHHRIGFGCRCYGKSCVRYESVGENSETSKLNAVRYKKKDWDGEGTCDWKTLGGKCICKNEKFNRKVIF